MKLKALSLATAAALLAACGGEAGDEPTLENWQTGEVYYSFPYDGQQDLAPKTPLSIRFSHPVTVDASHFTLLECAQLDGDCPDTGNNQVALQAPQPVDEGMGVMLQPAAPLQTHTHYRLVLNGIETENGSPVFPDGA